MADAAQKPGDPISAGERLDFSAFVARFFPGRCRHDFAAVAAYSTYRNELAPPSARDA